MENSAIYGTPSGLETPYITPSSTPHRVSYRLNPVKLVRQHVPLKLQSSHSGISPSVEKEKDVSTNSNASLYPMRTKRNRCVIQPTPVHDGVGDQRDTESSYLITNFPNNNANVPKIEIIEDANEIQSLMSVEPKSLFHSQGDAGTFYLASAAPTEKPNHELKTRIPISTNHVESELSVTQMWKSIADVEKDVKNIDKLVRKNLEKLHDEDLQQSVVTEKKKVQHVKESQGNTGKDIKQKKQYNKIQDRVVYPPAHECEKKKFYDPGDIRKYMMKKKNERRAREKEEKCKKENELATQKRKIEVTKLFLNKPKFPSYKHQEQMINEEKFKLSKKVKAKSNTKSNEVPVTQIKRSSDSVSIAKPKIECGNDENHLKATDLKFNKLNPDFEDLRNYAEHLSAEDLKPSSSGDKIRNSHFELEEELINEAIPYSPNLPSEVDILHYKNPYNFLDILKSKMNLARSSNYIPESEFTNFIPASKRTTNGQCLDDKDVIEDLMVKRKWLGNCQPDVDVHSTLLLERELTLSDLNLSHDKKNETFIMDNTDNTSTIRCEKNELKENRQSSMEMSGILPLVSSRSSTSPLSENNKITNVIDTDGPDSSNNVLKTARMILQEYNLEVGQSTNLIKTTSIESLVAPNVSVHLPKLLKHSSGSNSNKQQGVLKTRETELFNALNPTANLQTIMDNINDENRIKNVPFQEEEDCVANASSTALITDLYDQMIRNEDEKLTQLLKKILQQKEALNKYLRSEVFALELRKNEFKESREEEKIRVLKKKQRAVLLKVTKSVVELDRMKKSVIDTVEKRKTDLLKQKLCMRDANGFGLNSPKLKKKQDSKNRTFLISNQTKTFFGVSSSSCTSMVIEEDPDTKQFDENEVNIINTESSFQVRQKSNLISPIDTVALRKDSATSPVHFNSGISIRLNLNPENIMQLKNSCTQVKIEDCPNANNMHLALQGDRPRRAEVVDGDKHDFNRDEEESLNTTNRSNSIKIKRALSPVVFSPSKKVLQTRRQSSGSDITVPSLNDTSTTDQSDLEVRISALQRQLKQRKLEADHLRKEERKIRKERLRSKEQSLIKQIEAYEYYIKQTSQRIIDEENTNHEIIKPLIKPLASRRQVSEQNIPKFSNFAAVTEFSQDCEEDLEMNTDSERPLIKADSGILIESEITEPSEKIDELEHRSESRLQRLKSSPGSEVLKEVFILKQETSKTHEKSSKFLELVNDLHSEVFSLSEQLYSSDFIEDIPEDLADTKSEVSENVTNENNTSMSIEEIFSDRVGQGAESTTTENVKTVEYMNSAKSSASRIEVETQHDSLVVKETEEETSRNICSSESQSDTGLFNVKNMSDIESLVEAVRMIKAVEVQIEENANDAAVEVVLEEKSGEMIELHSVSSKNHISEEIAETSQDVKEVSNEVNKNENSNLNDVRDSVNPVVDVDTSMRDSSTEDSIPKEIFNVHISSRETEFVQRNEAIVKNEPVLELPRIKFSNFITEYGAEETDISESLEYDGGVQKSVSEEREILNPSVAPEDDEQRQKVMLASRPSVASSKEKDRSLEEMVEDHSLPNILGDTFVIQAVESTSDIESSGRATQPAVVSLPTEAEEDEDDLDMKITKAETPLLQALRREGEILIAKKKDSVNNLVSSLCEETFAHLVNSENVENGEPRGGNMDGEANFRKDLEIMAVDQSGVSEVAMKYDQQMDEWNENMGDSSSRFREEEELRLQQIKIEKEIKELQAQQNIPPYIYLRKIPNKPPPPYTPHIGQLVRVPSSESELHQIVKPIIDYVCEQLEKEVVPEQIVQVDESGMDATAQEASAYKRLLFDLTKEIACGFVKKNKPTKCPLWEELTTQKTELPKLEGQRLRETVERKMSELFGLRSKIHQENLIIQWSRKKKTDFVDDLLIQELQEEEGEWINYEEDELIIKNKITNNLLNELINDTVVSLQDAFQMKSAHS